ncbi:hypothetical protein BH20GEM2_BH20GEM2_01550 [soil metagenome]
MNPIPKQQPYPEGTRTHFTVEEGFMWRTVFRLCLATTLMTAATPVHGQSLRQQLLRLFSFGPTEVPLRVFSPADQNDSAAGTVINDGFALDASQANASLVGFLDGWMRGTVANVPFGSLAGGTTFDFVGGTPQGSTISPGPVVGEVGRTLGTGRLVLGANQSFFRFTSLRGTSLDDLTFNFTHRDACPANSGSCAAGATSPSAADVLQVDLGVDFNLAVTSFYASYGLLDRVDIGVVVPLVYASLSGSSTARVLPFSAEENGQVATFVAGTAADPILVSEQFIDGSAFGIGDIGARLKLNVLDAGERQVALLGDVRLPTGDEENLLGAGATSARALGVASARFGSFSPFANLGYRYWAGDAANDALLATVGFDKVLGRSVAFTASVVSEFQLGESVFAVPDGVILPGPLTRTVQPAEIPAIRDDAVSATLGFKFVSPSRLTAVVNTMFPLTSGGPRPDLGVTAGFEYPL